MKYAAIFSLIALVFFAWGCDETEIPINTISIPDDGKAVLVEDFTGIKCPNCPEGARVIEGLKAQFGKDRVISIAAYTDGFDGVLTGVSRYDLHAILGEEEEQYQENIGVLRGKPTAAIDRILDGSVRLISRPSNWSQPIIDQLNLPSLVNVSVDDLAYDPATRRLTCSVVGIVRQNLQEDLKYTAVLIQNGIIDPQEDVNGWDTNYVHNNVLMDIITPVNGTLLGAQPVIGDVLRQDIATTIPSEDDGLFFADSMELVVFAHFNSEDRKEVLNVVKTKFVQK